ncbi:MAG: hypothetical protein LJE85_13705 [Gammaproteobacteria bacterium]|jgi:hypothetical protein|nr:hypothetical protein [Gammaproteobacteria bacterium]
MSPPSSLKPILTLDSVLGASLTVQAGGLDKILHMLGVDAQVQGDMHADSSLVV